MISAEFATVLVEVGHQFAFEEGCLTRAQYCITELIAKGQFLSCAGVK